MVRLGLLSRVRKHFATVPPPTTRQEESGRPWHTMPIEALFGQLKTNETTGLTDEQVQTRLNQYGPNTLPEREPPTMPIIFLHQFKSPLIFILLIAANISLVLGEAKDAIFIFVVLLLNAVIGTTQEWKAEKSAVALQNLLKTHAKVRRNREECDILFDLLVPGDIVLLESGAKVPADMRLIEAVNLTVDESLLTGESVPVEKKVQVLTEIKLPISERTNMAFAGTFVSKGRGVGVVVATGLVSEVGKISEAVTGADVSKTPLLIRMENFTWRIGFIVLAITSFLGIMAYLKGLPLIDSFLFAVALAVSAIPEGLPVAMTVALSIATQRMAKRHVITRQLSAVEGLGSCTFIVTDKTGTLTINKQIIKLIALPDGGRFKVTGEAISGEGEVTAPQGGLVTGTPRKQIERLAKAGVICSEGHLNFCVPEGTWDHEGDPVDVAILALAYKIGVSPDEVRKHIGVINIIPYESERRFAATFFRDNGDIKVAIKGAFETILPFCALASTQDEDEPIQKQEMTTLVQTLAESGYRVLAVAEGTVETKSNKLPYTETDISSLTMLGLICMIDPLRPEAKEAVEQCQQSGIQVAMVTGDHPATALAIARELGIAHTPEEVLTGQKLAEICTLNMTECIEQIRSIRVFARVTPLQKLNIVENLINLGHFVAVTGDGVNDAPALRRANIGVAMGSGSDISKDVASIIIADDRFATIEAAVEEGRYAYGNIRKVVWFLISNGTAEVILFVLSLFFNLPLPLLPAQILWLNLITAGIQDVGLAFEAGEKRLLRKRPIKPTEGIFNQAMITQTLVTGGTKGLVCFGAWYWFIQSGWSVDEARNTVLLLLVLLENFHAFNARSEYQSTFKIPIRNNPFLVVGVIVAHCIHLAATHIPLFQNILGVSPVSVQLWLILFALASSVLFASECHKFIKRRKDRT